MRAISSMGIEGKRGQGWCSTLGIVVKKWYAKPWRYTQKSPGHEHRQRREEVPGGSSVPVGWGGSRAQGQKL